MVGSVQTCYWKSQQEGSKSPPPEFSSESQQWATMSDVAVLSSILVKLRREAASLGNDLQTKPITWYVSSVQPTAYATLRAAIRCSGKPDPVKLIEKADIRSGYKSMRLKRSVSIGCWRLGRLSKSNSPRSTYRRSSRNCCHSRLDRQVTAILRRSDFARNFLNPEILGARHSTPPLACTASRLKQMDLTRTEHRTSYSCRCVCRLYRRHLLSRPTLPRAIPDRFR